MDSRLKPPSASSPLLLAQITTIWSNILKARGGPEEADAEELARFFERYQRPVLSYLRHCVGDENSAADLFQEFALRFVRGDFAGSRPRSGSFRQYLKTALVNLVRDHYSKLAKLPRPGISQPQEIPDENQHAESIDRALRDELLGRAWEGLERQQTEGGPPNYAILRERVERPDLTAAELGVRFAEIGIREATDEVHTRKLVQRAREAFAGQLLDATRQMLGASPWNQVEEELAQLGLLQYCERVLKERRTDPESGAAGSTPVKPRTSP